MIKSRALEVNLARTQVDVAIDAKYTSLQEVMSRYYGLLEGLNVFLKEISHPYKNWQFIVDGARGYALDQFHLFKSHAKGPDAAGRLIDLFFDALAAETPQAVKVDAADNLILFLQKIIKTAEQFQDRFDPLLEETFGRIGDLPDDRFELFVRSFYALKRLGEDLVAGRDRLSQCCGALNRLLARSLESTYTYWLSQKDPMQWFIREAEIADPLPELEEIFSPVTHLTLLSQQAELAMISAKEDASDADLLHRLLELYDHHDIVQTYRQIPTLLLQVGGDDHGNRWKVLFLFHIMNIVGLEVVHEDTLRDINRTLNWLIANQRVRYIQNLVQKTFSILKTSALNYPATALTCVLNMGRGIFKTDDGVLIDEFIDAVIDLGFQAPMIKGVGNDWQIQVNNAHIQNIRTWLELVELRPKPAMRLLSNLIIHLAVSGVFIRDTDLFGRDVTRLLNADIGPVYNLTKQLARLLPVYFNDIGAEGELRDTSTRIDEICHRRDPLIHFLRKQSHVEGSNRVFHLMEAVLHFWTTRDKSVLTQYLPPNIFEQIDITGPYIDGVHKAMVALSTKAPDLPKRLLNWSAEKLADQIDQVKGVTPIDRERVLLFAELFKQLNNKYNLDFLSIRHYLTQLSAEAFPELERLKRALAEPTLKGKITTLLDYLDLLKSAILSPQSYEVREDIYKKRHFTVDIPSMYGSYHELKFDALGLTLRIEALVNVLLEEMVATIDLSLITKATCYRIFDMLKLFDTALRMDGIASTELDHHLDLLARSLDITGFSFTQYLDIYKGFAQAVKNIINDYFNNIHGEHATRILAKLSPDYILPKYFPTNGDKDGDPEKIHHRISEIFLRDRLATSLGLQQLDLFLSRILNTMFHQSNKLPRSRLHLLLNYDPQRAITAVHNPNPLVGGIIFLGNKGLNLIKLQRLGLPVPPGFIITTEVFRCREIIETFAPAQDNLKEQIEQHIRELEHTTGKRFGDPSNPLLFSVRSGSSISQPGMMDTFLNVGINQDIAGGLADQSGNAWFAWDSYRRFLQCYGMGLGMQRDDFDAVINSFKIDLGIPLKKEFSGEQMRQVALAYKQRVVAEGYQVPSDPMAQLYQTVRNVIQSWESPKAKAYRQIMGISDDWGTAITVQAMVYGNRSHDSGAGVIFTHNPRWYGESLSLWGDFTLENQGEDVVAGLVQTLPISVKQQEIEMRETDITLETHFPDIYTTMKAWALDLVSQKEWSPQEMEFTFESPSSKDLYLLQTRDMGIREHKRVLTFDPVQKAQGDYLGHGIGVSAGAMSGRVVFNLQEVEHWRKEEPGTALILARGDTVPDDIKEIFATDGLLTARGGVTSHAAVVAHRLGKTCVVGCGDMICDETNRRIKFGGLQLESGEYISIDGREGSVYRGLLKFKEA